LAESPKFAEPLQALQKVGVCRFDREKSGQPRHFDQRLVMNIITAGFNRGTDQSTAALVPTGLCKPAPGYVDLGGEFSQAGLDEFNHRAAMRNWLFVKKAQASPRDILADHDRGFMRARKAAGVQQGEFEQDGYGKAVVTSALLPHGRLQAREKGLDLTGEEGTFRAADGDAADQIIHGSRGNDDNNWSAGDDWIASQLGRTKTGQHSIGNAKWEKDAKRRRAKHPNRFAIET
jgi:hypothetical protein